jgi:DNA-binding NarL/FixJ family response regulator
MRRSNLAIIAGPNEIVPYKHNRVLIADDHPVVREGSSAILRSEEDIKVVVEAADGEETCALYDQLSPDVLLLDLRMPKKDGPQVVAELMARKVSKPRIIVMTAYETEEDIRQALKAGAKAFLVKAAHPQQIREAVRRVAKGESFLPPEIGFKLAEAMSHPELSNRRRVESSRKSDEEIDDRAAFVTLADDWKRRSAPRWSMLPVRMAIRSRLHIFRMPGQSWMLLYRLSRSPHVDRFLLRGAILFVIWSDEPHR